MSTSSDKKLRVVLFLNSLSVPQWVQSIYKHLLFHPTYEVTAVVINERHISNPSSFFYRLLRKVDRKLFKVNPDPFKRLKIELGPEIKQLVVSPIQKKFSDSFTSDDIQKMRDLNPDLILRFGFRIIRGEILSVPKYGIWSLHHADHLVNRGGPPGFWEVALNVPITGITLQTLTEDLDGGNVISKSFIKTDHTSFNRNQAALYWSAAELFKNKLNDFAKGDVNLSNETSSLSLPHFYSHPLYKDPDNLASLKLGFKFLFKSSVRKLIDLFYNEQWAIGYVIKSDIESSFFRYKILNPPKGCIWADPFCIRKDSELYLFAEQKRGHENGEIICFKYNTVTKSFKNLGVVLKEPFHLSYPFVFENDNRYYMIPESGSINKVVLYESEDFPFKWKQKKTLIDNIAAYDSTLYYHENLWYLFTSVKPTKGMSANEQLYIYYTNDLLKGKWLPHKLNPVKHDVRGARPAGKIFKYNGRIYRPAQIASYKYGYGIKFFEIKQLSSEVFEEVPVSEAKPLWDKSLLATHTFNYIQGISVVDFQKRVRRG